MSALMFEEGSPDRAGFHKHRRNLLIVSWALFAGLWVGISFDKLSTLHVFGHTFLVHDPSRIGDIIWMMWVYFLVRYFACHMEITRGHREERFWVAFQQELKNRYGNLARVALERESPQIKWHEAHQGLGPLRFTRRFSYDCHVRVRPGVESEEQTDISLAVMSVWLARLRAFNSIIFSRTLTSQYYLPYAIAVSPVVLLLYGLL